MSMKSGQVTVSDSGSTHFPDIWCIVVGVKAHPDNTDTIWFGNDGDNAIATTTGYPLNAGESLIIVIEGNLNNFYAVAEVDNEKLCWFIIDE